MPREPFRERPRILPEACPLTEMACDYTGLVCGFERPSWEVFGNIKTDVLSLHIAYSST